MHEATCGVVTFYSAVVVPKYVIYERSIGSWHKLST
jgi:hypothetical protein